MKLRHLFRLLVISGCLLTLAGCGGSFADSLSKYQPVGMLGMGKLSDIAYSPQGTYLAAVSPQAIILYDPNTLEQVRRFETDVAVTGLAFSPDESKMIVGTAEGRVEERDAGTGQVLRRFGEHQSKDAAGLQYSSKGTYALSLDITAGGNIHLWDVSTGSELRLLERTWGAAISPDESMLARWVMGAAAITFEGVRDGKYIAEVPVPDNVQHTSFAFSPDGQLFVYGFEGAFKVVNMADFSSAASIPYEEAINHFAFSPDGRRLAVLPAGYSVDLFDTSSWSRQKTSSEIHEESQIWSVEFTADGERLLTRTSKFIRFWDPQDGKALDTLDWPTAYMYQLHFTAQGDSLWASSTDGIQEWSIPGGELVQDTFINADLGGLAIHSSASPDGKLLATSMWMMDKTVLWDGGSGSLLTDLSPQDGTSAQVNALTFSADGSLLAIGYDNGLVEVWNMAGERSLAYTLKSDPQADSTSELAFAPDGKRLAAAYTVGDYASSIGIWALPDGTLKTIIEGPKSEVASLAFSPDGSLLAAGAGDHTAAIWKASNGKLVANLVGHESSVNCLAFSPDGSVLATGSGADYIPDHKVRFWNTSDGTLLHTLEGQQEKIMSVAFSPDGQYFASGSLDGTILVWQVNAPAP